MKRFWFVPGLLLLFGLLLQAEEPTEQFIRIYNLIQQADTLNDSDQARLKYLEAQTELKALRKAHPDWNETVVGFRLKYVAEKLEPLSSQPPAAQKERTSAIGESAGSVPVLQEQVRRLKADKELLEAKLKEALTAQPAAIDPRELAKAEERIKALQKELDVLKVNLAKTEPKPEKPVELALLEESRRRLVEANQKLAQQSECVAALTLEKEALANRLQASLNGDEIRTVREENESLKRQSNDLKAEAASRTDELRKQTGRAEALAAEKKTLESKLNDMTAQRDMNLAAKARALQKELAEAKAIAQANAAMASVVQTALESAQREKATLETEKDQIERERDELGRKLEAATKELCDNKARAARTHHR